jgi:hypothetical protein
MIAMMALSMAQKNTYFASIIKFMFGYRASDNVFMHNQILLKMYSWASCEKDFRTDYYC